MTIIDNREGHRARFDALRATRDLRTAAFDHVGGGDYEQVGFIERAFLDAFASVPENGLLVDVGCGPGCVARYGFRNAYGFTLPKRTIRTRLKKF
jgi:hypothetical protein